MLNIQEIAKCLNMTEEDITDAESGQLKEEYLELIDTADDILYAYVQDVHTSDDACVKKAECQQMKYLLNNPQVLIECVGVKSASVTNFNFTLDDAETKKPKAAQQLSGLAYQTLSNCGLISMGTRSCKSSCG